MTPWDGPPADSLYGSGLVTDGHGLPLRPGGAALSTALISAAGFRPGGIVLDIGCGRGESLARLRALGWQAVGIDQAAAALCHAGDEPARSLLVRGNGLSLPFADASLDGVLAECSLSVMPDRAATLLEWARVLRPGGSLALSDVYHRRDDAAFAPAGATTRARLQGEVRDAGLGLAVFEDHSDVLREWVARFIFRYGTLDALWAGAGCRAATSARAGAPGYCLLIARKPDDATGGPGREDFHDGR
ncbi:Class I SAM-dependent methyltransferase [Rhodovastum atsumiense]|uniref:Class I SAM-dependent methyltransferase n=1 Tax=Rhodovastum atsumiense TaxID=504468 RepID=A0A5M6IVF7_9PROT|nr:class I SAM-dependent methyltransferase [Rhodovastum atsumiense]KAA5612201.1 class I SAM-dependent methyltransferase [Rhodovastum atsumiense]CAH2603842.1 Class I SAM-dependent methyltransferase [Rhodovastum atsumiense]